MINLLKILRDFFFVITSHNIFDAWPKTTFLLPVWHRDAKRLGIPAKWNPPMCIWVSDYLISLFLIPSMFWKFFFLTWRYVTPFNVDSPQRMKLTNSNLCLCLRHRFLSFYIAQFTVVKMFLHCSLLSQPPPNCSHSQSHPLSMPMGPLHSFLDLALPLFSLIIPFSLPSGYCQFVLYFHVSSSFFLVSLFCWSGST